VPLMVVGRATEARPAANFHTRVFSLIFLIPDCISEVGAEFDYCFKSCEENELIYQFLKLCSSCHDMSDMNSNSTRDKTREDMKTSVLLLFQVSTTQKVSYLLH
jgi:hypothetical protein